MNLSDCKTIEEYRDAAHYWQKQWAEADKKIKEYDRAIIENLTIHKEINKLPIGNFYLAETFEGFLCYSDPR